jgi:hypothetical protein
MMFYLLLQASGWAPFLGRFHPLLVHLPIGFLLIAALLEAGRRTGKVGVSESTVSFILFWSAIGATLSCVAGYLLSLDGGYQEELLDDHMWQGIGVAVFAWIAWAVKTDWLGNAIPFGSVLYDNTNHDCRARRRFSDTRGRFSDPTYTRAFPKHGRNAACYRICC